MTAHQIVSHDEWIKASKTLLKKEKEFTKLREQMAEERRNAFVAVTRSKRLIYFSYPRTRLMPWGDTWNSRPSPYVNEVSAFLSLQ